MFRFSCLYLVIITASVHLRSSGCSDLTPILPPQVQENVLKDLNSQIPGPVKDLNLKTPDPVIVDLPNTDAPKATLNKTNPVQDLSKAETIIRNSPIPSPQWLPKVLNIIEQVSELASSLGVPDDMLPVPAAGNGTIADSSYDAIQAMNQASHIVSLAGEIVNANKSILGGGRSAITGLRRLHTLVSKPYGHQLMSTLGTVPAIQMLVLREITPDSTRGSGLSLIGKISHLPGVSQSVDPASGSYYHVNIMLPSSKYNAEASLEYGEF